MSTENGLLTTMETKEYLREKGVPLSTRTMIRPKSEDDEDNSKWPFVFTDDGPLIDRHQLDNVIKTLPHWLFVLSNKDLESRCGYMPIPTIQREFGILRETILEGVLNNDFNRFDRGSHLHPMLRWLVNRGEMFAFVQTLSGRRGASGAEGVVQMDGEISLNKACQTHGWSKVKILALQELLPLKSNAASGKARRYYLPQTAVNCILADEEFCEYLTSRAKKPRKSLLERLQSGVIFSENPPASAQPTTPPDDTSEVVVPTPTPPRKPSPASGNGDGGMDSGRRRKAKAFVASAFQIIEVYRAALIRGEDAYEAVAREFIG